MTKVIENIFNSLTTPEQRKQIKENIDNSKQFISNTMSDFGNVMRSLGNINLGTMSVNDAIDYMAGVISGDSDRLSDVALDLAIQAGLLVAFSGKMPASVRNIVPKIKSILPSKSVSGVKQVFKDMSEGKVTGEIKQFVDKYKPNFTLVDKPYNNYAGSKIPETKSFSYNRDVVKEIRNQGGEAAFDRQYSLKNLPSTDVQPNFTMTRGEYKYQTGNPFKKDYTEISAKQAMDELGLNKYPVPYRPNALSTNRQNFTEVGGVYDKSNYPSTVRQQGEVQIPNEIDKILWKNGTSFKQLADELGVKSKKDIPKLFKFVDELGQIIKNSPKFIRGMFDSSKGIYGILGNTGLSLVDIWLAFNEDGTLMPDTLVSNAARLGASAIPGSPLLRLIYGSLGYFAGDALSNAALKKLFPEYLTPELREEVRQGTYHPGIENEIGEYQVGNSGRRYHVKNGRIYAYDTGRPVNIREALNDINTGYEARAEKNIADTKKAEQYANDLRAAKAAGYNIPDEQIAQADAQVQRAYEELNNLPKIPKIYNYDPSGDLVQQYQEKEVIPRQQQQQVNQQMQAQQDQFDYEQAFNMIAQNTYNDLTKYVTDEAVMAKYYQYMGQAYAGNAVQLSPEEFKSMYMMDYMQQMAPQISQQANQAVNIMRQAQADKATQTLKLMELAHNQNMDYADIVYNYDKLNADLNQKAIENAINQYEANIKGIEAQTAMKQQATREQQLKINQQNADTARMQIEQRQQMIPYQQAGYLGEMFGNMGNAASFGGIDINTMLNSNPELFGSVLPGTKQQNGMVNTQSTPTSTRSNTNQQLNQNQSMIDTFKRGINQ